MRAATQAGQAPGMVEVELGEGQQQVLTATIAVEVAGQRFLQEIALRARTCHKNGYANSPANG